MIPFLKQTAIRYYQQQGIENTCFIFPNRRSEAFFRKYLAECLALDHASGAEVRPLLAPQSFTVNDFLYSVYGVPVTDRISLLLELYGCYCRLYPGAETLDEFIFWGDVILGDFNDVDKYLADPEQLFANVSDFKALQDTFSYLTETQRQALENFVGHFNDADGRLTVDLHSGNPNVKERFLQIWNILFPLYRDFRKVLDSKGMAYEGMVYRGVAELFRKEGAEKVLPAFLPHTDRYVFVGLNALNECEKTVLRSMRDSGLAEFCWDYSGELIRDRSNKSSFFMEKNIEEFPPAFEPDPEGVEIPEIHVVSVPSAVGQTKQIPAVLRRIAREQTGGDLSKVGVLSDGISRKGADCAIVLPDEGLLMPVLNTIPLEVKDINVTMGYPMSGSEFYSYMDMVASLQLNMRKKGDKWYFYHKNVWSLFSCSVFRKAAGEGADRIINAVKASQLLYIPEESFTGNAFMEKIFRPVVTDRNTPSRENTGKFADYLLEVIGLTAPALARNGNLKLEAEFATEYYLAVQSLKKIGMDIQPKTYVRLLQQIIFPVSVPFKGEPLQGLQVMGPLETRSLDFENLILLSCNEGVFPRKNVSSSFIPPELRKGFGLPTYEYQDSVWAYYFYRMITRASNVWMLYDSRTEGVKSGEESRYIKQLQYHFNLPLHRYVVEAALSDSPGEGDIVKTEEHVRNIKDCWFSASSLQTYLSCPARFYYQYVEKLEPEKDVTEVMDNGMFGTIFHAMMESLYTGDEAMYSDVDLSDRKASASIPRLQEVTADYISRWLSRPADLRSKIKRLIMNQIHTLEVSGRNLVVTDVILKYVMQTLKRDLELMKQHGTDRFRVCGLEKKYLGKILGFNFVGYIDRLDSFGGNALRIIDYKTGTVKENDYLITAGNAEEVADAIFGEDNEKRPTIALQLYIYDKFLRQDPAFKGAGLSNCIYSTMKLFEKAPESQPVCDEFIQAVDVRLEELFRKMTDVSVPFSRTSDEKICSYCDFKMICGR